MPRHLFVVLSAMSLVCCTSTDGPVEPSLASASTQTERSTFTLTDLPVVNSCDASGELILMSGTLHTVSHVTVTDCHQLLTLHGQTHFTGRGTTTCSGPI